MPFYIYMEEMSPYSVITVKPPAVNVVDLLSTVICQIMELMPLKSFFFFPFGICDLKYLHQTALKAVKLSPGDRHFHF